MMIKTLNSYSSGSKTDEIMSKYRPIAPKPSITSPMLELLPHFQLKPTRPRKRARTSCPTSPPPLSTFKRGRSTNPLGFCRANTLSMHAFSHPPPQEMDLLQNLRGHTASTVIAPQPVRPVGSTIIVGCITEARSGSRIAKKPEEVEDEVESEMLPAVVSDSKNKVRLVNSAYKEMVGQPECLWLDAMGACKRISGEVMLTVNEGSFPENGFSCWAKIEWESDRMSKKSVNAFCEVTRLACESKDYHYAWKFHTREPSHQL